jgi:predicted transcriptional regulator
MQERAMKKPAASAPKKNVKANFSIRLPPDVRAALDKLAEAEDRSAGNVALRFIAEGLKEKGFLK